MTEDELKELIEDCPTLYHMASGNSWASIQEHGLLSTSELLKLVKADAETARELEAEHRPNSVDISDDGSIVLRDQKPMSDNGLRRALPENISPSDWYSYLNNHVFFWLTEERLERLVSAKSYRTTRRLILELDTEAVIAEYKKSIRLCPINSGCTKPFPHPRDFSAFSAIENYPYNAWSKKRKKGERVVELLVENGVPNLVDYLNKAYLIMPDGSTENL